MLLICFALGGLFFVAFLMGLCKAAAEGDKMMKRAQRPRIEHRAASTSRTWIGGTDEAWVALRLLGPISEHDEYEHSNRRMT